MLCTIDMLFGLVVHNSCKHLLVSKINLEVQTCKPADCFTDVPNAMQAARCHKWIF